MNAVGGRARAPPCSPARATARKHVPWSLPARCLFSPRAGRLCVWKGCSWAFVSLLLTIPGWRSIPPHSRRRLSPTRNTVCRSFLWFRRARNPWSRPAFTRPPPAASASRTGGPAGRMPTLAWRPVLPVAGGCWISIRATAASPPSRRWNATRAIGARLTPSRRPCVN